MLLPYSSLTGLIFCLLVTSELRKAVADDAKQKESLQVAYNQAQKELSELEGAAVAVCQEFEGEGTQSGSSVISRLRAWSGCVTSRLKGALLLGVKKALGVVSTHYVLDMERLKDEGYVVAPDLSEEEVAGAIDQAAAASEETAKALSEFFSDDLFPDTDDAAGEA